MEPNNEELSTFTTMNAIFEWLEMEEGVVLALKQAVGATTSTIRTWARIPTARFEELARSMMVKVQGGEDRALTPIEEGQVGEVRAILAKLVARAGALPTTNAPAGAGQEHTPPGEEAGRAQQALATVTHGSGPQLGPGPGGGLLADGVAEFQGSGVSGELALLTTTGFMPGELGTQRINLAAVLDQADDTVIKPLSVAELRRLLDEWKKVCNDGEEPSEEDEATGDQLSALAFRLRSGATPYVDFGVWRPHGAAFGRLLKFAAYFLNPGGVFTRKELVGPTCWEDWEKSWRVYCFAMELLGAATRTRLARYRATIFELQDDYPSLWWIVAMADQKMRRAQMERIRRRLAGEQAELAAQGLRSDFDPARPWDVVFREAARDTDFWRKEVEKKVLQFTTAQSTAPQLADPGFGQLTFAGQPEGSSRKRERSPGGPPVRKKTKQSQRQRKAQRGDRRTQELHDAPPPPLPHPKGKGKGKDVNEKDSKGRYFRDSAGVQLCWPWNRDSNGCCEPCQQQRSHRCEICRGAHRTVDHRG